jgi:uncharacterized membrane protein (DUF2068 family)
MKKSNEVRRTKDIIRVAAVFEALKGFIVLITGCGLLLLIHKDIHAVLEHVVRHLDLNPARHYPNIFINAANHITDFQLVALALSAVAYSVVRFAEAYGLWYHQRWAEWFGFLAGGIYIPFELYELFQKVTLIKLAILLVNLFIVILLGNALYKLRKHRKR